MTPWLWALGDAVLHYLAPLLAGVVVGAGLQARFVVRPRVADALLLVLVGASAAALFVPAPSTVRIGLALLAGIASGLAIELDPVPPREGGAARGRGATRG